MRLKYSTTDPIQTKIDSLPRVPLLLAYRDHVHETIGLVDSGATVNVLPFELGIKVGAIWNDEKAVISLTGNLANFPAIPLLLDVTVGKYPPVKLAFAWVKNNQVPLILGQTNFFMEFDVCFYRSLLEFEIKPG